MPDQNIRQVQNKHQDQAQIVYFSHGGGPLPILGDASHKAMVDFMLQLPSRLRKPEAILVISAHWEESAPTLLGNPAPPMFYDYYGFPAEAYDITYPAPGSPELAERIAALLGKNNIPARIDSQRGFDHGLFIPLKMMYPQAEIPALQLSLHLGLDPKAHIDLGKALRELLAENILVIGSGFSFHNMNAFWEQRDNSPDPANDDFQNWLIEVVTGPISQAEREQRLIAWQQGPSARYCHPREEHLLPLHVCVGLANTPGTTIFDDYIFGKRAVAFLW
jgi:aromatic ring-opening dioxygenase catalytic subunit (LigB family)